MSGPTSSSAPITRPTRCSRSAAHRSSHTPPPKEQLLQWHRHKEGEPGHRLSRGNAGIAALRSLTTPKERCLDLMLIPAALGVLRVFLHWGALERIPRDCVTPISYAELAEQLGAEVGLLRRLAWTLVAAGFLKQVGTDQVVNTPNSVMLVGNPVLKGVLDVVSQLTHLLSQVSAAMMFPKYFERYGRIEPTQQRGSPWTFSRGQPDKTIWEIMQENPDEVEAFAKSMRASSRFYPMPGPYDFSWVVDHPIGDRSARLRCLSDWLLMPGCVSRGLFLGKPARWEF
ncbi:catechol O-methyltransferase [Apiospora phragmitis]|uniref:Catechol O-methyltransferase n=1 Tax=Apiospora phragmitis TaxID=2905665 RepID=A0ABR1UHN0_9PEZI